VSVKVRRKYASLVLLFLGPSINSTLFYRAVIDGALRHIGALNPPRMIRFFLVRAKAMPVKAAASAKRPLTPAYSQKSDDMSAGRSTHPERSDPCRRIPVSNLQKHSRRIFCCWHHSPQLWVFLALTPKSTS